MPSSWFEVSLSNMTFEKVIYDDFASLLIGSLNNAIVLSVKIIILITILIFIIDFIKSRKFIKNSEKNVSKSFALIVGVFLGITYGAGILIKDAQTGSISKIDLFYIATFLMICHAIIEDTLLFVIFGADFTLVTIVRVVSAIVLSYIMIKIVKYYELV